ncbi:topoisomerase DNA-binding C4 zinc finger domain-containing protein [Primorskyibacter marinus]|nr:topoisomerase DNA-binding C4 zinc finger domain-containing protein [Primorskyibacter marinus]
MRDQWGQVRWLVERRGRYGAFLGCVRFPDCAGKAKQKKSA